MNCNANKVLDLRQHNKFGEQDDEGGSRYVRASFMERFKVDTFKGIEGTGRIYRPIGKYSPRDEALAAMGNPFMMM